MGKIKEDKKGKDTKHRGGEEGAFLRATGAAPQILFVRGKQNRRGKPGTNLQSLWPAKEEGSGQNG